MNIKSLASLALVGMVAFVGSHRIHAAADNAYSPTLALKLLRQGNIRFAADTPYHPDLDTPRRSETARNGQQPFATVLACSDSRVPVEHIFDQGVGSLFVVRVAGNVADVDELGSMEYGVDHLGTPLLVVLGHTSCGAVTAVAEEAHVHGHIPALVDNIIPAVQKAVADGANAKNLVAKSVEANVWQSVEDTLLKSTSIRQRVLDGEAEIVGAIYDLNTGMVNWLGRHPKEAALLELASHAGNDDHATHAEDHDHTTPIAPATTGHATARKRGPSSAQVLTALKQGNDAFAAGKSKFPRADDPRRTETATSGQKPTVTVLACSDSRVPVELLMDQGIGDVFTIRVAGNVADTDEIGSIEYGVDHLETPLLVVMGHTGCGAVTAVAKGAELHGHIPHLVDNIIPAVQGVRRSHKGDENSLIEAAVRANVWQSIQDVITKSSVVRQRVADGRLEVVGAVYDLESGTIEWMGHFPDMGSLLAGKKTPSAKQAPDSKPSAPAPTDHAEHKSETLTAIQAIEKLTGGNGRFADETPQHPNFELTRRQLTASNGQHPFATVLACSDSRVPVEAIFDQGIGDLFVIRVAGNVADTTEIGSMEYGVNHLHTPVLVVMGHTGCGAVTAAVQDTSLEGMLPALIDNIRPAAAKAASDGASESEIIDSAVRANIWQSISDVLKRSKSIRDKFHTGEVEIIGAVYHLDDGHVEWLNVASASN